MSSYTSSLLDGIGGLLHGADIGIFDPDHIFVEGETGIFRGVVPDIPERAIGLTAYPVADDDTTNAVTGVQFRMRAGRDPDAIDDDADAVFDLFHNKRHYELNGIRVALSYRQSQAWIGQDTKGRMELTANYYFRAVRSGSHLND